MCTYHMETSPFSFGANQWTDFVMIETSVMKELNQRGAGATKVLRETNNLYEIIRKIVSLKIQANPLEFILNKFILTS